MKEEKNASQDQTEVISESDSNLAWDTALEVARYSLEEERERERTLIGQSGWMITSFSALSIVVATLVPSLLEVCDLQRFLRLFLIGRFFAAMFASLILALIAQWRWKRDWPASPMECFTYFQSDKNGWSKQRIIKELCELYEDEYASIDRINARRAILIKVSSVMFFVAIGIAAVMIVEVNGASASFLQLII